MWCPSATLSLWANAWFAGKAAPDDVLDALSQWAPTHSVVAYDAVAAGHTGLSWPDAGETGVVSLLRTLRSAAGRAGMTSPSVNLVLPVAGDVRGLAAGTRFESDALGAGEALIASDPRDATVAVGVVPEFGYDESGQEASRSKLRRLSWTVYSLPGAPAPQQHDLGEAEYGLRSAVRSAAEALSAVGSRPGCPDVEDPRGLVEQLLESTRRHQVPGHAPSRALRVLHTAAHVQAIIAVGAGLTRAGVRSSSDEQIACDELRPLAAVVRSTRMAAVSAILHSAWRS
jgi:hypothetical protein